jgi:tRNA modification GTPase
MTPSARRSEGDLIAALATGTGPAAIAVLRLSGAGALSAARTWLVGLPASPPPRRLMRAIAVQDGEPLDDVLAAIFPAPHSYTGENVVEVHCHGGPALVAAIQATALSAGARLARPGEFTERAVLNGKMDLLDAEALVAVLAADGSDELRAARASRQMAPLLRDVARRTRAALAGARGSLDYPLELASQGVVWRTEAAALEATLGSLLASPALEDLFREGSVIALLGPPNAGKSSLFNALVAEERALVDAAPGTTRDAQPCALFLSGRRFTIVDTAGIREVDGIEGRAVARSLEISRAAHLNIWVEDVSASPLEPVVPVDLRVLAKSDLRAHPARSADPGSAAALLVSASSSAGISELRSAIEARSPRLSAALSGRQRRLVGQARVALGLIIACADDQAAEHLAEAEQALAQLVGVGGGLVEAREIYARFCVGK